MGNPLSKIGGLIGGIFGGPLGGAAGEFVGEMVEGAAGQEPAPAPPTRPPSKPIAASRTIWLNMLASLGAAVLAWVVGYDWSQAVSPTTAIMIVGAANIALRFVTYQPLGR